MKLFKRDPLQKVSTEPQPGMAESMQTLILGEPGSGTEVKVDLIAPLPDAPENSRRRVTNYRTFKVEFFSQAAFSVPPTVTDDIATQFIAALCEQVKLYVGPEVSKDSAGKSVTTHKISKDQSGAVVDESVYDVKSYMFRIDPTQPGTIILHTPRNLIPAMILLGSSNPAKVSRDSLYPIPVNAMLGNYYYTPDRLRQIPAPRDLPMLQRPLKNQAVCVCGGKQTFELATSPIFNSGDIEVNSMVSNFRAGCSGCISVQKGGYADVQNLAQSRSTLGEKFFSNHNSLFKQFTVIRKSAFTGAITATTTYGFTVDTVDTRVLTEEKYRIQGHVLVSNGLNNFRNGVGIASVAKLVTDRKNKEGTSPTSKGDLVRDEAELKAQLNNFVKVSIEKVAKRVLNNTVDVAVGEDTVTITTDIKSVYDAVFLLYIFRSYTLDVKSLLNDYVKVYSATEPELVAAIAKAPALRLDCQRKSN